MLTDLQQRTANAIVNVFETGAPGGDYGKVTLLPGDTGHLTYGRSQTTLASGNLHLLIRAYVAEPGAAFAPLFARYLDRLAAIDLALDHDMEFRMLLRDAGDDPVMQTVQDAFFDRVYWQPSVSAAQGLGLSKPLSVTTLYDSHIHGSWRRMRDRTTERHGAPVDIGEEEWIEAYIKTRREWLANHANRLLHLTVYRMDSLTELMDDNKWTLRLPVQVRGIKITRALLDAAPVVRASAGTSELLMLRHPMMRGDTIRKAQQTLLDAGMDVAVDGVFGPETEGAVRDFQREQGLTVDGIIGPATRAALKL